MQKVQLPLLRHYTVIMRRTQLFRGATRPFPHTSFQRFCDSNVVNNLPLKQKQEEQTKVNCINDPGVSENRIHVSDDSILLLNNLCQEINVLRSAVLELKKEVIDLKSLSHHEYESIAKPHDAKQLTQEVNEKESEEIDINFDDYLHALRRKKLQNEFDEKASNTMFNTIVEEDVWYT